MKITVFTSNQPRHISLVENLASIADEVHVVTEAMTLFPGQTKDYYDNSPVMQTYFKNVTDAEKKVFGEPKELPKNAAVFTAKMEDLSKVPLSWLENALKSDMYVVFGASYIKGALIDFLVDHKAYNIHMGVSPYYRGSSCNFWASYDKNYHMVGGTIHLLSKGLDSGDMLYHALPAYDSNPFVLGMNAVKSALKALTNRIADKSISEIIPIKQDQTKEIRYTRNKNFNDAIAEEYLKNLPSPKDIEDCLAKRDLTLFNEPYIDNA